MTPHKPITGIHFLRCEACGGFGPAINGRCPGCLAPKKHRNLEVWILAAAFMLFPVLHWWLTGLCQ